ncbi:MAG: PQQ-dependent sugar dehydrogenase [Phycisphaerae bacterium]|nr:PQQ-dependent sugar dehydrogenase [Gemmatimonadaceae bacterium]
MSSRHLFSAAVTALALLNAARVPAQGRGAPVALPPGQTNQPFPQPIVRSEGVISVGLREFASLPDINGVPARAMTLVDEPTTRRLFVSDMFGLLYAITPDGKTVSQYVDIRDPKWGVSVQSQGRERGLQSFTLHPQFAQAGAPGYGKFYTYTDIATSESPTPDFTTPNPTSTHETVLLEWTAKTPGAATYDGGAPRELFRLHQPFANHNGGAIAFNRTARSGGSDFGLLYVGVGDGGSGGDPMGLAQNLGSAFGKILRIDPLGKNARGGKFGIPASNPFVSKDGALPEIFAYGVRNTQRFSWDTKNGAMFMSDIGQNIVEEVSPVTAGANLGWNIWEGSFRYMSRQGVSVESQRGDASVTFPIAEFDQLDSLLLPTGSAAAVGLVVYRSSTIPQLNNRIVFGDMPSGEVFHVSADALPKGGQDPIRRVLFVTAPGKEPRTALAIIREKNVAQGKSAAARADLRFDVTATGQIFVLNKADGTIRVMEK